MMATPLRWQFQLWNLHLIRECSRSTDLHVLQLFIFVGKLVALATTVNEGVNWVVSNVYGYFASESACWRLMPYDVWNGHSWNRTIGIWSESKSIINYNIKPRVSKCEWLTYSRLLRVDQVVPPVSEPVNYRLWTRRANHSATAPHNTLRLLDPIYLCVRSLPLNIAPTGNIQETLRSSPCRTK